MSNRIRNLLAEDGRLMIYRPSLRAIAGSVNGAIILSQFIYWDDKMDGKFYKFTSPCTHDKYKPKESFEEELGMSKYEINSALSKFALKLGSRAKAEHGENYKDAQAKALVTYYTDSDRVTWYKLNREVLDLLVSEDTQPTLVSEDTQLTKESEGSQLTITRTKTTTKTTTDIPPNPQRGNEIDPLFLRLINLKAGFPIKSRKVAGTSEVRAWNKIKDTITVEDVELLERFYVIEKDNSKHDERWHRKNSPDTMMNQLVEQLEHAKDYFKAQQSKQKQFTEFAPIGEIEAY